MVYFMENPIKMDDLGVPLFLETSISTFTRSAATSSLVKAGVHCTSEEPYCVQLRNLSKVVLELVVL